MLEAGKSKVTLLADPKKRVFDVTGVQHCKRLESGKYVPAGLHAA